MALHSSPLVSTSIIPLADSQARAALAVLDRLFNRSLPRPFAIRFWDGTLVPSANGAAPLFTLVLNRPAALRRMLLPGNELALGEAFLRGDFDIEGDIIAAMAQAEQVIQQPPGLLARVLITRHLLQLRDDGPPPVPQVPVKLRGRRHSRRRDLAAVTYHYNIGNTFFQLWLDQRMVYSCAYFPTGEETLDEAQEAKLEYICRKLRLRPGERFLDIGCGWGGLILYATEHYGVQALGVTLSEPQAQLARQRIAAAGLSSRCRVEVRDYRDLRRFGQFDKIASVGMFEHVGRGPLPIYFREAFHLLRPGGLFLNHGIAAPQHDRHSQSIARRSFIDRYVFPDGDLVRISTTLDRAERAGFEVRDVESLREHYAQTLRHWVQRLEARREEAMHIAGEVTYRIWRIYMAGSAYNFARGNINVYQALLARPERNGRVNLPRTRADLYRSS
jgi:cyclopropane-fatty-acyl-phospholipid synthase